MKPKPTPHLSPAEQKEVAATISAMRRLQATAARKALPWRREPPHSTGIWLAAKWQHSGFYATQRLTNMHRIPDLFDLARLALGGLLIGGIWYALAHLWQWLSR